MARTKRKTAVQRRIEVLERLLADAQQRLGELRISAGHDADALGWIERYANHEIRITRRANGVTVDRWYRRYVSYHSFSGRTLRDALREARELAP